MLTPRTKWRARSRQRLAGTDAMEEKARTSMCNFGKAPAHATVSVRTLEVENVALKKKSEELQAEIARMKGEISQNTINTSFTIEAIKENNTMFKFYTGFTDYKLFKIFLTH